MTATQIPGLGTGSPNPKVAERVRSAALRASTATVAVDGCDALAVPVTHLDDRGNLILVAPADATITALAHLSGRAGLPAMVELADTCPVEVAEPVRAIVWIRGTLLAVDATEERALANQIAEELPHQDLLDVGHGATMLRLEMSSIVLADGSGATAVEVADVLRSEPDPFTLIEAPWLTHLSDARTGVIPALIRRLPLGLRTGRVLPLSLDKWGITLRVETDGDTGVVSRDVRMPFSEPAFTATDLSRSLRILMGCPFLWRCTPHT